MPAVYHRWEASNWIANSDSLSSEAHTTERGGWGRSEVAKRKHSLREGNLGSSNNSTRGRRARCCSAWSLDEIKRRPSDRGHSCHATGAELAREVSLAS